MMTEREFLRDVLRGNDAAVAFVEMLGDVSQTWDDLVDADFEVEPARITTAFRIALLELPLQPFYAAHFQRLFPLVEAAVMDWLTANQLEAGDRHDRSVAFVIRDSLTAVVIAAAGIVGGPDWAIGRAAEIRRFFHDEALETYLEGLEP